MQIDTVYSLLTKHFNSTNLKTIKKATGLTTQQLVYLRDENIFPQGEALLTILTALQTSELSLRLRTGIYSDEIIAKLSSSADDICSFLERNLPPQTPTQNILPTPEFSTRLGKLYQMDCIEFLNAIPDDSIDLIFADPPFNLNKIYPSQMNDDLSEEEYFSWCKEWALECTRVLRHGGSLFIWNLPKWNAKISSELSNYITFKNWIATELAYRLPIKGRLYPGHYSLLYFTKGTKPNTFNPDRLNMKICRKCKNEIKDYGGYKSKMNPKGINLSDVWTDISPVRHSKYKRRNGANELPLRLLDRIIEIASKPGDLVLDPFGGSGTTYITAELKNRQWMGTEIGPLDDILSRFANLDEERDYLSKIRSNLNTLFTHEDEKERKKRGLWTCDDFK